MRTIVVLLFGSLILFGCSPQKKLRRLLDKNPYLSKTDTVYKVVHDTIPEVKAEVKFDIDTNTAAIDSIVTFYKKALDSLLIKSDKDSVSHVKTKDSLVYNMKHKLRGYVANKVFIKDTIIKQDGDVTVKVWQKGSEVVISVYRPPIVKEEKVAVAVTNVDCPPCKTKWYDYGARVMGILFLVILILYLVDEFYIKRIFPRR